MAYRFMLDLVSLVIWVWLRAVDYLVKVTVRISVGPALPYYTCCGGSKGGLILDLGLWWLR